MNKYNAIFDKLKSQSCSKSIKKKTVLVRCGDMSKLIYVVEEGCLRLWYNEDGKDVTAHFFQAGDAVAPIECLFWNEPASMELESIVPSKVFTINHSEFKLALDKNPELYRHMSEVLLSRVKELQERLICTIKSSPTERYREFAANNPELIKLVPQHYIASYLGITSVSLSRIINKG